MTLKPYKSRGQSKKQQVKSMFNNIAHSYDSLNHILSLGIDRYWRKKAVGMLSKGTNRHILDVATGTADLAITAYRCLKPGKITGIDISEKMLEIGMRKITRHHLESNIELIFGDSECLEFKNNTFDAAMVAFGVRNFEDLAKGLSEIYRVLAPGAKFIVLEFSSPSAFPVKQLYNFYFQRILPALGNLFSKDKHAYHYLPESVNAFPEGIEFVHFLNRAGFINEQLKQLTFGIATIYSCTKPSL